MVTKNNNFSPTIKLNEDTLTPMKEKISKYFYYRIPIHISKSINEFKAQASAQCI